MTLKNNRAPLLSNIKLYVSFHHHMWIQTGVTVRKRPIWVKFDDFYSHVTLKFDGSPWKTIGHLVYATSSIVQHFVPIGEFKLELQSGNAQSGSNSMIFRAVWPWNLTDHIEKTIGYLFYATSSFVQHFVPIGKFKLELQSGNAQSGSNSTIFRAVWPWNLTDHIEKTIGYLFYATSSFVQHFVPIGKFKLELQSGNAQSGSNLTIFRAVWPWNLTDDLEKQ